MEVRSKAMGGDLARFGTGGVSARGGEKAEVVAKDMVVPVVNEAHAGRARLASEAGGTERRRIPMASGTSESERGLESGDDRKRMVVARVFLASEILWARRGGMVERR